MKPDSGASLVFSVLKAEFIAPKFVLKEFYKYKEECLKKSKLSERDFEYRKDYVFSKIKFIELYEFKSFFKEAIKICKDKDDVPYFALALKLKLPLWSNDKELKKQDEVRVLSTKDLIEILF